MTDRLTRKATEGAFAAPDALIAELATVLALVEGLRPGIVNVGHGRDPISLARARVFLQAWTRRGEQVGAVVSWPAAAASWLRPATRLADDADTWVVADLPGGWAGVGPRLATTARWDPARTVAFAPLADPDLPRVAGRAATEGIRGATPAGEVWRYRHGLLVLGPPATTTLPAGTTADTSGRTPCSS